MQSESRCLSKHWSGNCLTRWCYAIWVLKIRTSPMQIANSSGCFFFYSLFLSQILQLVGKLLVFSCREIISSSLIKKHTFPQKVSERSDEHTGWESSSGRCYRWDMNLFRFLKHRWSCKILSLLLCPFVFPKSSNLFCPQRFLSFSKGFMKNTCLWKQGINASFITQNKA